MRPQRSKSRLRCPAFRSKRTTGRESVGATFQLGGKFGIGRSGGIRNATLISLTSEERRARPHIGASQRAKRRVSNRLARAAGNPSAMAVLNRSPASRRSHGSVNGGGSLPVSAENNARQPLDFEHVEPGTFRFAGLDQYAIGTVGIVDRAHTVFEIGLPLGSPTPSISGV